MVRAIDLGFTTYGLSEHAPRYRSEDLFPEEVRRLHHPGSPVLKVNVE